MSGFAVLCGAAIPGGLPRFLITLTAALPFTEDSFLSRRIFVGNLPHTITRLPAKFCDFPLHQVQLTTSLYGLPSLVSR